VETFPAFKDKSEPRPQQLPVVESASALNDKSELLPRQLPVVDGI
jgi:hypothetical protein